MELTKKEQKAIDTLKKAAKIWPDSLWLFSASGTLFVMRMGDDGRIVMSSDGAVDSKCIVDKINIPNDGGDW